jgi:signal transduction histidine kinase
MQKMNLMTHDILSYVTITLDERMITTLSLRSVMDSVVTELHDKLTNVNAAVTIGEGGQIQGNFQLLTLLFQHLIKNAIKFRDPNRPLTVDISFSNLKFNHAEHHLNENQTFLAVAVKDNGIGFEPTENENIFGLFYKISQERNIPGSGVGLAVAKKIMEIHDGFITAQSRPREGTTLICYFPLP